MDSRHLTALAVLGVLAIAFTLQPVAPPSPGQYRVIVVGPQQALQEGTVFLAEPSALTGLLALAEAQGFSVHWDDRPGCTYDYVRGVAGIEESSTGGWNYYVRTGGLGAWDKPSQSSSCPGLQAGQEILWCWVEPDERCALWP